MAISLPTRGQRDWDDELNNALNQMDATAESASATASSAISTANNALNVAQSVQGAVIGTADEATAGFIADEASATKAVLSATYAAVVQIVADGSDQTADINAALAGGWLFGARVTVRLVGDFGLTNTLIVHSNTTLDTRDATLTMLVSGKRMIQNAALSGGGARDTDIAVVGGYWNRAATNGAADPNQGHSIVFHRADRVSVSDVRFNATGAVKYAIYGVDVTHFTVERIDLTSTSDGVHITGPASYVTVRDIIGTVEDDLISFTGRDYTSYELTAGGGNISDILVERAHIRAGTGVDGNVVKLLPGAAMTLSRAVVRSISQAAGASGVTIYSDTVQPSTTGGTVKDVLIDGVSGTPVVGFLVNITHGGVENVTVRNVRVSDNTASRAVAFSTSGGVVKRALIDGITSTVAYTGSLVHVGSGMTVNDLQVSNVNALAGAGLGVVVQVSGTIDRLQMASITQSGGRAVLNVDGSGLCPLASINGMSSSATYGVFVNQAAANVEVQVTNVIAVPTSRLVFNNAGTTRLRGSGITGSATTHIGKSAGTISATGNDVRADTSTLTPVAGDTVYNTASGELVGAGCVNYNGTAWVNAQTGASMAVSVTWDPPSVPAGGQQETSYTATGAVVGDQVRLSPPAGIAAGLVWSAYVSAANTVTIRLTNVTGSAIDPASGSWKFSVIK